jgi:hypothetical protein
MSSTKSMRSSLRMDYPIISIGHTYCALYSIGHRFSVVLFSHCWAFTTILNFMLSYRYAIARKKAYRIIELSL